MCAFLAMVIFSKRRLRKIRLVMFQHMTKKVMKLCVFTGLQILKVKMPQPVQKVIPFGVSRQVSDWFSLRRQDGSSSSSGMRGQAVVGARICTSASPCPLLHESCKISKKYLRMFSNSQDLICLLEFLAFRSAKGSDDSVVSLVSSCTG